MSWTVIATDVKNSSSSSGSGSRSTKGREISQIQTDLLPPYEWTLVLSVKAPLLLSLLARL